MNLNALLLDGTRARILKILNTIIDANKIKMNVIAMVITIPIENPSGFNPYKFIITKPQKYITNEKINARIPLPSLRLILFPMV